MFDLVIGQRGLELRVPVHDAIPALDDLVINHHLENRVHRAVPVFIQGVPLPRPIAARSHLADLLIDAFARLRGELHHALQKLLASEFLAGIIHPLFDEQLFDFHLRGNGRMVRARHPERFLPAHAMEANEQVLNREHGRMPHVQCPRPVRRRHHDAVRLLPLPGELVRIERTGSLPILVDLVLNRGGVVRFWQFVGFHISALMVRVWTFCDKGSLRD